MAMKLDEMVRQLQQAYGSALRSVVLYGSAVAGEHIAKRSDYNLLVILDSVPLDRLAPVGAVLRAWGDAGNPPPMTFTRSEWRSSSDIFPMEYSDILENHRVLHGEDPTSGISVSRSDLRLEVEQQALGKLLQLRREAMAAGDAWRDQVRLMEDSLGTIMAIFRAVVRLDGGIPSHDYADLVSDVARRAGFDAEPLHRIVAHVRKARRIDRTDSTAVLTGYLAEMEALVAWLDRFET